MPLRRLSLFLFVGLLKLGILFALFSGSVHAFLAYDWPDDPDHTGGVSHETITRMAFNNMVETYWPGQKITHEIFMARATMITANTRVDDDQFHTARHFDAENFDGGQYVLTGTPVGVSETANPEDVDLLHQILWGLETYSIVDAQVALGKALHTIQDFYSHSNYVELGYDDPHPGVGRVNFAIEYAPDFLDTCTGCIAAPSDNECDNCDHNLIVQNLTSGYYPGEDRSPFPNVAKCRHGGPWDDEGALPGDANGINKDSMGCGWSPHGPKYHRKAVELAIRASEQFINDVRDHIMTAEGPDVTEHRMRLLFGVDMTFPKQRVSRDLKETHQFPVTPVFTATNENVNNVHVHSRSFYTYPIPVDTFTTSIRFAIRGAYALGISRPDGSIVDPDDLNVDLDYTHETGDIVITILNPLSGVWDISLDGVGKFSLDVSVASSIHFSYAFAEIRGRAGHSGWSPNPAIVPTPGSRMPVLAYLEGAGISNVSHHIRTTDGDILVENLSLSAGSGEFGWPSETSFFGYVDVPSDGKEWHVYATGHDSQGNQFLRQHPVKFGNKK